MSTEAKDFYREMKGALRKGLKKYGINLISFRIGHYDCSGMCEREGKFVYISHSINRGFPVNLDAWDPMCGFLYRTSPDAESCSSGHGPNKFTDWLDLPNAINKLMERRGVA
jgi:hypothetical protein